MRSHEKDSAHGLVPLALVGARLEDPKLAYRNLRDLVRGGSLLPNLCPLHYPGHVYNADLMCNLPAIVIEMLPATDEQLPRGTLLESHAWGQL